MNQEQDYLQQMTIDKWEQIQEVLKLDLPRSICGYNLMRIQRQWMQKGFDFGFKVFCPFGNAENGMVAFVYREQAKSYEMIIECPKDDTKALEKALITTKSINWETPAATLFAASHVTECFKRISADGNFDLKPHKCYLYILDKRRPLFEISLPAGVTFGLLSPEHATFVDSKWPHRYPGSDKYHLTLIQNKFGYGLFKNNDLIAWTLIKEIGSLGHIYTLEDHRKKGYGEMIVKLVCNELLKEASDVFSYVVDANMKACKLHEKIGFQLYGELSVLLTSKKSS